MQPEDGSSLPFLLRFAETCYVQWSWIGSAPGVQTDDRGPPFSLRVFLTSWPCTAWACSMVPFLFSTMWLPQWTLPPISAAGATMFYIPSERCLWWQCILGSEAARTTVGCMSILDCKRSRTGVGWLAGFSYPPAIIHGNCNRRRMRLLTSSWILFALLFSHFSFSSNLTWFSSSCCSHFKIRYKYVWTYMNKYGNDTDIIKFVYTICSYTHSVLCQH